MIEKTIAKAKIIKQVIKRLIKTDESCVPIECVSSLTSIKNNAIAVKSGNRYFFARSIAKTVFIFSKENVSVSKLVTKPQNVAKKDLLTKKQHTKTVWL